MMNNNYITRRVVEKNKYFQPYQEILYQKEYNTVEDLISEEKRRILVLADAGYGKSTELKHLFRLYSEENPKYFVPVYINLDTYTDENVHDYIINKLGSDSEDVLAYDRSKLIFLFDEFDQVYDKSLATRKMKNFMDKYANSYFVIASRTNLYSGQFNDRKFENFILLPFSLQDVKTYVRQRLNDDALSLIEHIEKKDLYDLIKNPFYLRNLIDVYASNRNIPNSKNEIVYEFIKFSLESDIQRLDKEDLQLNYPISDILKDIKYYALVMETYQRNHISEEDLAKLQEDKEKRVIFQKLSLIRKSMVENVDVYQFQHNNFQEFLAAELLSDQNLSTIQNLISVVPKQKKIIASWINTISFMFSHLDSGSDLYRELLDWMLMIEPEILINFELGSMTKTKRAEIFKRIYERYKIKKLRINRDKYLYRQLAQYADSEDIIKFLLDEIESGIVNETIETAISLLRFMNLPPHLDERAKKILTDIAIDKGSDKYTVNIALIAITELNYIEEDILDKIVDRLGKSKNDWIRFGLYYLISESNNVDKYIDLFLAGLKYTTVDVSMRGTETRLADESYWLKIGLEKANSIDTLKKILKHYSDNPDHMTRSYFDNSLEKIITNSASFGEDSLFDTVVELLLTFAREFDTDKVDRIIKFFEQTGTKLKAFKKIYKTLEDRQKFIYLASIVDQESFDFIIQEYQSGALKLDDITIFRNNLKEKDYKSFTKAFEEETGTQFKVTHLRDYNKEREERRRSDIELVFDRDTFIGEMEKIYKKEDKESFSINELFGIKDYSGDMQDYSDLVLRTLRNMARDKDISFKNAKKLHKDGWEIFIVGTIYNYTKNDEDLKLTDFQIKWLKNWCETKAKSFNFKDALVTTSIDSFGVSDKQALYLWFFLRKYRYKYPENVLLDMLSFDYIETNSFVGINYLEDLVSQSKIKVRIKKNLKEGIKNQFVLRNHIGFCVQHGLKFGLPYALETIKNSDRSYDIRQASLNAVIRLSENKILDLENVLNNISDEFKWELVKKLMEFKSDNVRNYLIGILSSENEDDKLQASRYLMQLNDLKGLKYFSEWTLENKRFQHSFLGQSSLSSISDIGALPMLFQLLKLNFDKDMNQDRYSRLETAVRGALSEIAYQSEENFKTVRQETNLFIEKNVSEIDDLKYLYFFLDDLENRFYQSKGKISTINEAIRKIESLKLSYN